MRGLLLAIVGLGLIGLIACRGSGGRVALQSPKTNPTPQNFSVRLSGSESSSGKIAQCAGDDPASWIIHPARQYPIRALSGQEIANVRQMPANTTGGALVIRDISCASAVDDPPESPDFTYIHLVASYRLLGKEDDREGEEVFVINRRTDPVDYPDSLWLVDTKRQQKADQAVEAKTDEAFSAKATAGRQAYEQSATAEAADQKAIATEVAGQAPSQVRVKGSVVLIPDRTDSWGYPTFNSSFTMVNPLRAAVELDMEVRLSFPNGEVLVYATTMRLMTSGQIDLDQGEHVVNTQFFRADEENGPLPDSTQVQAISYKLFFSDGGETDWITL